MRIYCPERRFACKTFAYQREKWMWNMNRNSHLKGEFKALDKRISPHSANYYGRKNRLSINFAKIALNFGYFQRIL